MIWMEDTLLLFGCFQLRMMEQVTDEIGTEKVQFDHTGHKFLHSKLHLIGDAGVCQSPFICRFFACLFLIREGKKTTLEQKEQKVLKKLHFLLGWQKVQEKEGNYFQMQQLVYKVIFYLSLPLLCRFFRKRIQSSMISTKSWNKLAVQIAEEQI